MFSPLLLSLLLLYYYYYYQTMSASIDSLSTHRRRQSDTDTPTFCNITTHKQMQMDESYELLNLAMFIQLPWCLLLRRTCCFLPAVAKTITSGTQPANPRRNGQAELAWVPFYTA